MFGGKEIKCPVCNYRGKAKNKTKGSFIMEVVLWCLFIVPGFIYSVWRLTSKVDVCPRCGNTLLIPADIDE
jgi:hypothetical protein